MYIGIDDTDSRERGCSTYVLTEIIRRSGLDLIGYPRLVRLNPSVPWKTRGNGALCAKLGKGKGRKWPAGHFDGRTVYAFESGDEGISREEMIEISAMAIYDLAELLEDATNPGIVVGESPTSPDIYWKCVRGVEDIGSVTEKLKKSGHSYLGIKNGRGIIGAAAALSWVPSSRTYEALLYRYPHPDSIPFSTKMNAAVMAENVKGSFNNIDVLNTYPAIFPRERTPVVMGIRSTEDEKLLSSSIEIAEKNGIEFDRDMIFETNQATDEHIEVEPAILQDFHSYRLSCVVSGYPYSIRGSHYFVELNYGEVNLKAAAFEPTKEFRRIFRELLPGDRIVIYGSFSEGVLNVEKMEIISLSTAYIRENPICENCNSRTENRGRNDFRCRKCGSVYRIPHYRIHERELKSGRYDVPVIARRHLSRPFSLGGSS
ncbi:MAG: tRNA(Ile)(2)-agmatinylcytidine synthase [Candidatus Thermoplasmatota archaeon]|jgi:tRNA(Ile2)-agmatinylcytidine synthase|nr:tRNA(Ile)(2)-agmatinylcytidine synthase [Candidatus Thermoplasmatota archaeon]